MKAMIEVDVHRIYCPDCGKMFASRLKRARTPPEIECVTMDMSNGYMNFVENSLPGASIVFDHFHVVKMINDKINKIRWLVRQAYGYRDYRYFRLKVFDLPNLKPRDSDC